MEKYGFKVDVPCLPTCQVCANGKLARFDARLTTGVWANVCTDHFQMYGCGLGVGKGQRLIVRKAVS